MTERRGNEPPRKGGSGRGTPPRSTSSRPPSATDRARATPQRPESTRERLLRQERERAEAQRRAETQARRQRDTTSAAGEKRRPGDASSRRSSDAASRRSGDASSRRPQGEKRAKDHTPPRQPTTAAPRKRVAPKAAGPGAGEKRRQADASSRRPTGGGRTAAEGGPRRAPAKKSASKRPPQNRPQPRPKKPRVKKPPKTLTLGRPTLRLRLTFGVMAFVLSLFAGRLVLLQGVDPDSYALAASKENNKTYVLHAPRGSITDRNGVEFSVTEDTVAIVADPSQTKPVAQQLVSIMAPKLAGSATPAELLAALTAGGRYKVVANQVAPQTWNEIKAEMKAANKVISQQNKGKPKEQWAPPLLGLYTEADPIRNHPNGSIAATVVGITGKDGKGLSGLEYGLNGKLSGQDGKAVYEVDANGNKIPNANHTVEEPRPGVGAQLTLDRDLQWFAERRIQEAVNKYKASAGTVIVTEVKSNEILAMANYPTFDPNVKLKPGTDLSNPALERTYEPGSVQKVVTMAALADAGLIDLNTKLKVPGTIRVPGGQVKDHWPHGDLNLTIAGVIAKSSNVGTIMAAQQMRIPTFVKYLHDFGFGEPTGLNFPGESKGRLMGGDEWPEITRANVAFGQGLSVNAVQEASAVNAVANGGVYVPPKLIRNWIEPNGSLTPNQTAPPRRVVSEKAAKEVSTMMEAVTAEKGTAPQAAIDGYLVAGKTGTAQQVDSSCGCYRKWATSFAGFAPADNPRFVVYVVLHDPTGARGGGFQGGPVFRDVMSFALQKYAVPPTGAKQNNVPITW